MSNIFHVQCRGDRHAITNCSGCGAEVCMKAVNVFRDLALRGVHLQVIVNMDPLDHQHVAILTNLACHLGHQPSFTGRDIARFQRASDLKNSE